MKHSSAWAAMLLLISACTLDGPDDEASGNAASGSKAGAGDGAARPAPRPGPTAPKPPEDPPTVYNWSSTGTIYDFDSFSEYGVNLVDPDALMVRIPGAYVGDRIVVEVAGSPYAERIESDVICDLRAHVADGLRPEMPFESGGSISFALDMDPENRMHAAGAHTVIADGITYVRLLGRVSRPDRFCGLTGTITIRVTQEH